MSEIMAVILNGSAELEYNRGTPLPDYQAAYLDKMDEKMDSGIMIADKKVNNPDITQRAQFVASNLYHAIKNNNEAMAASLCTYLAHRIQDLKQIKFEDLNGETSIDLVFDEEYKNQVSVKFTH